MGNLLYTCVFWHLIFGWLVLQVKLPHVLLRFLWPPIWVKGQDTASAERCRISVTTLPNTTCGTRFLRNLCPAYSWEGSTAGSKTTRPREVELCVNRVAPSTTERQIFVITPLSFPTVVFSCPVFLFPHVPNQPNSRQKSPETTFLVNVLWGLHPAANAGVKYFLSTTNFSL